jgi:hypothetical protein
MVHRLDLLRKDTHKFNSPAGDDKRLEAVGPQVSQQLQHRLEDQVL